MTKEQLGNLILDSERQLYSTAKTILFSDQDCVDAIQETIVKAFSKIDTLKNDKYARTWLIRILINECYNLVRKSSKFISFEDLEDRLERREIRPGGAMFCGMDACSFYKIEPSQSLLRNASSPEGESF